MGVAGVDSDMITDHVSESVKTRQDTAPDLDQDLEGYLHHNEIMDTLVKGRRSQPNSTIKRFSHTNEKER